MTEPGSLAALAPAARLFGRLLVRELDVATLRELQQDDVRRSLLALGVPLPAERDLEALAAEYCEHLLLPQGERPPVQSLWTEGRYDGDAALAVRTIAAAAARELAPGARGAAPDHAGAVLLLWADLVVERPELADRLRRDHVAWIAPALAGLAQRPGFYGAVARAVRTFAGTLTGG